MKRSRFTLWRIIRLVLSMGWSDFILKYRGSVLGYVWSFLVPLSQFLVLLFVFQPLMGSQIPHYPLYLFLGIVLWQFFANTTSSCITMLHEKAGIIQKVIMPRIVLIFAAGWTQTIIFCTHAIIFFCVALLLGVHWSWQLLWLAPLLLCFEMITLGIGMILSSYALKYQDVPHLWQVLLQMLFWLTPVTYAPQRLEAARQALQVSHAWTVTAWRVMEWFVTVQPATLLVTGMRSVMLPGGDRFPMEGMTWLIIMSVVLFSFGLLLFLWRSPYFIEEY